jgi:hypothetical protein
LLPTTSRHPEGRPDVCAASQVATLLEKAVSVRRSVTFPPVFSHQAAQSISIVSVAVEAGLRTRAVRGAKPLS